MRPHRLAALSLIIVLWVTPALSQVVGTYEVEGDHPDRNETYRGTVSLRQTGTATYEVVWLVGKDRFVGTAIGDERALAIAYSGPAAGIVLMRPDGPNGWIGLWTPLNSSRVGNETWTRK